MEHPVTAVYDANVLYPAPLRDLLIRLAQAGLVRARWTDAIHDEWMRNVLKDNPGLSLDRSGEYQAMANDPRLVKFREGLKILQSSGDDRAERIQMLLSDAYDVEWRRT